LRLDVVILEADSFTCESVDSRCWRQTTVAADVPLTNVVAHHEDDIWLI
jgi:hypothetical protein